MQEQHRDALELGHALLTMVEPQPATVREYNHWYETDHFLSGVLAGPGAFAGRRFVATRALKAVRFPAGDALGAPLAEGSFIAVYWIEREQLAAHCEWGFPEAARLAGLGRMRSDRTHISTSYYDLEDVTSRRDHSVPIELALHHRYHGLVMIWTERSGDAADADAGAHETWASTVRDALTADGSPIAQVVSFRPVRLPAPLPAMPGAVAGDPDARRDVLAHCCFVDRDLRASWLRLSKVLHGAFAEAGHAASPLLVAPFLPAVAGTDTYLDQLW